MSEQAVTGVKRFKMISPILYATHVNECDSLSPMLVVESARSTWMCVCLCLCVCAMCAHKQSPLIICFLFSLVRLFL